MVHQHLLEPALQGRVFFDVLAVFVEGCGPDAAQLSTGQHWFEQVARVHGSACGAGPHHGVDLIDEEHNPAVGGGHLLEDSLEPFFKLAAILGPGDQGAHVEGNQLSVL